MIICLNISPWAKPSCIRNACCDTLQPIYNIVYTLTHMPTIACEINGKYVYISVLLNISFRLLRRDWLQHSQTHKMVNNRQTHTNDKYWKNKISTHRWSIVHFNRFALCLCGCRFACLYATNVHPQPPHIFVGDCKINERSQQKTAHTHTPNVRVWAHLNFTTWSDLQMGQQINACC